MSMVSSVESMVHRGVCLGNRLCGICDSLGFFCAMADFDNAVHLVSDWIKNLKRTIALPLQSSAAEYNAYGFRAIPILPGEQLASQAQSSR
jgi:hypothetical protein